PFSVLHRPTADGTRPLGRGALREVVEDSRHVRQRSLAQSVWSASSRASRRASHVTADSKGPSRMTHDQSGAGATRIQSARPRLIRAGSLLHSFPKSSELWQLACHGGTTLDGSLQEVTEERGEKVCTTPRKTLHPCRK